jgi:hypothetical protein
VSKGPSTSQPFVYWAAIALIALMIILITSGGLLTGSTQAGERPSRFLHEALSIAASAVALVVVVFLYRARGVQRTAGLWLLAAVAAQGAIGTPSWMERMTPFLPIVHATLAPLFLGAAVWCAVVASAGWQAGPIPIKDAGWPSLRSLAIVVPVLLVLQILLGAAFRHQAMGVMSHIAGALIVVLIVLLNGMFVTQQCAGHKALQPAAVTLMTLAFAQVVLGIGAITMRMMTSVYTTGVASVTAAHVVTGSLTFGASVWLSVEVRRHITPKD